MKILTLALSFFVVLGLIKCETAATTGGAVLPVDHSQDDPQDNEYNLVCHKGSDEYCHEYFGYDYCCAKWDTTIQVTNDAWVYICTEKRQIELEGGSFKDETLAAVEYTVYCAWAQS